jgi:hypothetical protein
MLAEPLPERECGLEHLVRRALGADDLHERHEGRRVEEVHPDNALRRRGCARNLRDRERGGVRREHCVGPADPLELGEKLPLRTKLLDDRLDHDLAVRERREVCRQREQADVEGVDLAFLDLARQEVLDAAAGRLPQLVGHLAAHGLETRLDRKLRDARAHRPQPDDSDLHEGGA